MPRQKLNLCTSFGERRVEGNTSDNCIVQIGCTFLPKAAIASDQKSSAQIIESFC